MKRREAQLARERNEKPKTLYDIDFLLGVYDESRMGALRFKIEANGDFLDNNKTTSTPPWSSIREPKMQQLISKTTKIMKRSINGYRFLWHLDLH
jgi:hypothetical protein